MRFLSEINLRLEGDRGKAAQYITRARTVLGELWNQDIELGGLNQASRRLTLEGGAVQIEIRVIRTLPPMVRIFAETVDEDVIPEGEYLLLAAWYPEGIVMTPRSAANPQGFGLPSRDPVTGDLLPSYSDTDPVFPQILMNRFANNKYLDRAGFVTGTVGAGQGLLETPPQLRADASLDPEFQRTTFRYWYKLPRPLDYDDSEGAVAFTYDGFEYWRDPANQSLYPTITGEYRISEEIINGTAVTTATLVTEQRDRITGGENLFEPESPDTWYAHRPEEVLYPTAGHEKIFTQTNVFRGFFGAPPVLRQLRGDGNPALIAVAEVAKSGDLSHNSLNFQPGFRTADGKVLNASGVDEASGENLAAGFTGTTEDVGEDVADAWFGSTGHRNNMLSTAWDNDNTIPGAIHSIGYTEGTIDEQSENIPDINTYPGGTITGGIWSQVFHKRKEWVPVWDHTFSGDYGETGWTGLGGPEDNTALATVDVATQNVIPFRAFFGFRGCRYALPDSADDPRSVRVMAVAVYSKDVTVGEAPNEETVPQLWFRVALLLNDVGEDFINNTARTYGDGTIKIFTAPVGVTEANYKDRYGYYEPDKNRTWELEDEYDFPFALDGSGEGWLYPAYASAAISPDGQKFCFTYQKYKIDTQPLLHRSSTDFTQTTNRDVMVAWLVHIEKEIDEEWVLNEQAPPTATVSVANALNTPGNYRNSYTRTLNAVYDYMPYYDDENVLGYVQLSINDFQTQSFEGYMWRVRKLIFGSGKEVVIDYQALENFLVPDFAAFQIAHPTFPREEGITTPFNSVILHLDPKTEDVVLQRNLYDNSFAFGVQNELNYDHNITMDLDLGSGDARLATTIASATYVAQGLNMQTFTAAAVLVNAGDPIPFDGPSSEFLIDTRFSFMVYNYKSPAGYVLGPYNANTQIEVEQTIGGTWPEDAGWYVLPVQNRQVMWFANWDGTGGSTQYDPASYGLYDIEGMYNAADYEVSIWQPPYYFFEPPKDNMYQTRDVFSDQIAASLYTDNVGPRYTDFRYTTVKLVRYQDRVVLRADLTVLVGWGYTNVSNGYVGPYATAGQANTALHYPEPYQPGEIVSADARVNDGVLLWANFDLDAAAEIVDVTDISPFGRAV
jgi:hypothetical protein